MNTYTKTSGRINGNFATNNEPFPVYEITNKRHFEIHKRKKVCNWLQTLKRFFHLLLSIKQFLVYCATIFLQYIYLNY